jgi:hypothetical protein
MRTVLLAACLCLLTASAADARKAGSRTVVNDGVKATLSWSAGQGFLGEKPLITITRDGIREVDHRKVFRICDLCTTIGRPRAALHVRDLDGDGAPEVLVDLFSGGAHCCYSTVIFVPKDGTYKARLASWGNAFYRVEELNGGGAKELVTTDDRFAERFTAYAMSYRPPQVFSLLGQKLVDVTRSFPSLASDDIAEIDKLLPEARKQGDPKGLIAARMADLAVLGRSNEIRPYLDDAIEKGDADAKFKRQLLKFLGESGYL